MGRYRWSGGNAEAVDTIFGYTGRDFDSDTGLQYNRARWYHPQTGRWLSQVPIGFAAGDVNLYWYVGNTATNATDPSGLAAEGHHWIPISVARLFHKKGLISLKEYHYFGGRTSGALTVKHCYDKDHNVYNEWVTKQMEIWSNNKAKVSIKDFVDNMRDGKNWDGTVHNANSYNSTRVISYNIYPNGKKPPFGGGTKSQIESRGQNSIANRDRSRLNRLLKNVQSPKIGRITKLAMGFGFYSANSSISQTTEILTASKAMENSRKYACKGDFTMLRQRLTGVGFHDQSGYEELLAARQRLPWLF